MNNPHNFDDFYSLGNDFLSQIIVDLNSIGLLKFASQIDHICYRVASTERYEEYKNEMAKIADLLAETPVNGRPIATYKLVSPLVATGLNGVQFEVSVVEVPAPKPNTPYAEGFEHVEIVVLALSEMEIILKQKSIAFELTEAKNDILQISMCELKIKAPTGTVKFHEMSLAQIIAKEIEAEQKSPN